MKKQSLAIKILNRMGESTKGTIYTNSDFYDLGTAEAVRKSLSRLCDEETIYRLIDGYYTIPYFIDIIQEYSYPSIDELAEKMAEKFIWNITPYGVTALNQVGLSTQVPVVWEYLSDGPYREYQYLNAIIKFKHTSNRNISGYSKAISLVIQSIKAIGRNQITDKHIYILAKYCKKHISENLLDETKSVPSWIYEIIKKIMGVKYDE